MLPALLVFPRAELEPVEQKEVPLAWGLEKMALHLNFILHSVRVSQGLCLGWPGAKCSLKVCQHHAGSVETQARDGTVSSSPASGPKHIPSIWQLLVPAQGQPNLPSLHSMHTCPRARWHWVPSRADTDTWGQAACSEQAE